MSLVAHLLYIIHEIIHETYIQVLIQTKASDMCHVLWATSDIFPDCEVLMELI